MNTTINTCRSSRPLSALLVALIFPLAANFVGAAQPAPVLEETFDALDEGSIADQNGWTCPSYAGPLSLIQSNVNANVGGKALELKFPAGFTSKEVAADSLSGVVAVDFKLNLPGEVDGKAGKFILMLISDSGKVVTTFFHDSNGRWGIGTGSSYAFSADTNPPDGWRLLRVLINFKEKKVSAFEGFGKNWTPIFSDVPFMDTEAENFKSLSIQNHEQGAQASIFVDDIVVRLNPKTDVSSRETAKPVLELSTPDEKDSSIFASGQTVKLMFQINQREEESLQSDSVRWSVKDWNNCEVKTGTLEVPAELSWSGIVELEGLKAGCYYVSAQLVKGGEVLPAIGSRPVGMASFGILPALGIPNLASPEQSRFGAHGLNDGPIEEQDPYALLYDKLGAHWTEMRRSWHEFEPNFAGEFKPSEEWQTGGHATTYPDYTAEDYARHRLIPIVWAVGVPQWATSASGSKVDNGQGYPIKDMASYAAFLKKVAAQQAAYRTKFFPYLKHSYYNITHEPDWHWKGTDAELIAIYKTAHQALHEGDSQAILLGPRYGVVSKGLENLERLFPLGLGQYIDGLETHAYYLPPHLGNSPEKAGIAKDLRRLRELANQYIRPGALMVQGEWGVRYEQSVYDSDITPELLKEHAIQFTQGHLTALGEGSDVTFFFYTHDYKSEAGYGMNFSLSMTDRDKSERWAWMHDRSINSSRVSPKPTFMAAAAMVRLLEGTQTVGPISSDPEIYAYRFKRGTEEIVVVWDREALANKGQAIVIKGGVDSPRVFDMMGNEINLPTRETGGIPLRVGREPLYIVSNGNITLSFQKT